MSEAQARSSQATQVSSQAQQAVSSLQQSIQQFLSAPLSSKAYDSAKNYFMVAYKPICQSIIMTAEAFTNAHKKFVSEYQATVGGEDIDEDKIQAEIDQYQELLHTIDDLIRDAKRPRPDLERRSMNAYEAMQKRKEKLEKLRTYSAQSTSFFSEYNSSQQELNTAINQVKDCKAWNASTGTFDLKKLDMNWAKAISSRWDERAKKMEQEHAAKFKKAMEGRRYVRVQIAPGVYEWMWVKDPLRVSQADFEFNETYKDYLAILMNPKENGILDDYFATMAEELRTGMNAKTGKPLTDLEKAQRWSTVLSAISVVAIGAYYGGKGLTSNNKKTPKKTSGPMCFVSGTLVLSEQGHKPIESIQIGDKVFAKHENSNIQSYEKVVQLFVSETSKLVRIMVGNEIIETTEEHPFYLLNKGWVKAKELMCNDNLIDSLGNTLPITDIQSICLNKPIKVYNFEVENAHTYFVSNLSILVHNICDDALNKWHKGTFSDAKASLIKHFEKHGAEVKANSLEQYLNKAEDFSRKLKGARTKKIDYPTPNVVRYYKNGKYIDIHKPTGKIISFGKQ
ncbi:polymorphic toxin-type HINT domain-containing protein [Candidatus Enterococcus palustris]|uniref:polymorphic toxin-type HINT domain-containing protein n=1 Tax=Candidatus Enterococcus palustris TaxID=1834189 RepID=UPI0030CD1029